MKEFQTILSFVSGYEGYIYLNRPEVHNALNSEMISEIRTALMNLNNNKSVRVIIIGAKGQNFSSGADLNYMKEQAAMGIEENEMDADNLAGLFYDIYTSEIPVITVSKGSVIGGANGIVAAADYSITLTSSAFLFSEVRLGLIPATIAPYVVDRIGRTASMELLLFARKFNGLEAEKYGLVNKAVENGKIESELTEILSLVKYNAPGAVKKTKKLLLRLNNTAEFDEIRKFTSKSIAEARASDEGREGISAFFEKRKARWVNENI